MEKKYLQLNDVSSYKISFHLSNYVWEIIVNWDYFAKDTVGKQFTRSIDSISANIAEGFGRYGKKDIGVILRRYDRKEAILRLVRRKRKSRAYSAQNTVILRRYDEESREKFRKIVIDNFMCLITGSFTEFMLNLIQCYHSTQDDDNSVILKIKKKPVIRSVRLGRKSFAANV